MDVRYPIGRLEVPATVTRRHIDSWLEEIAQYIQNLRKTVANLSQEDLQATYREEALRYNNLSIILQTHR